MITEIFPVATTPELEISASGGSVTVESGPSGEVEVEIDTRQPEAWKVRHRADSVFVSSERGLIDRGARDRVRLSAPEGSSLEVHTASADVRVVPGLERATVVTASGDVALGDAEVASVKTASGDVSLGQVSRHLTVRSASGRLRIRSVGEHASVTTSSGDVLLDEARGDLSMSSASGDLRVMRYLGEDLEASTMSGDLHVGVPAGRTVKLQAKTLSGSVRLPDRRQAAGANGPEVSIRLESVSGDILITRID